MFVLPLTPADRTRGGALFTPDIARERPQKGIVIAIGPGLWDDEQERLYPVDVQVGDLVTYGKYAGQSFELDASLEVFIMVNAELKARKPRGTYALTSHLLHEGRPDAKMVYHEAHTFCEHCPAEPIGETVADERRKLQAQHHAELHDSVPQADGDAGPLAENEGYCDSGCGDHGLKQCLCLNCGNGVYR